MINRFIRDKHGDTYIWALVFVIIIILVSVLIYSALIMVAAYDSACSITERAANNAVTAVEENWSIRDTDYEVEQYNVDENLANAFFEGLVNLGMREESGIWGGSSQSYGMRVTAMNIVQERLIVSGTVTLYAPIDVGQERGGLDIDFEVESRIIERHGLDEEDGNDSPLSSVPPATPEPTPTKPPLRPTPTPAIPYKTITIVLRKGAVNLSGIYGSTGGLNGGSFNIYENAECTDLVGTVTTAGANKLTEGRATFAYQGTAQTLYIENITLPLGYVIHGESIKSVDLSNSSSTSLTVTFSSKPSTGGGVLG